MEHPVCKTNSTAILLQHSEKATLSSQTKAVNKFHDVEAARHTAEISTSLNIYEQIQLLAPFHLKAPLLSWPLLCKGTPHYSPYPLSLSLTSWASMHIPEQFSETPETSDYSGPLRKTSRAPAIHPGPPPSTPLYRPLPRSFLCTCLIILAGFPQSILCIPDQPGTV